VTADKGQAGFGALVNKNVKLLQINPSRQIKFRNGWPFLKWSCQMEIWG